VRTAGVTFIVNQHPVEQLRASRRRSTFACDR
jgi:hypothetical protein